MRETRCPQCRSVARLVRNPYFGAGLAVHSDLLVCQACGFSGFADNADDAEAPQPAAAIPPSMMRRILRFLSGG
jgi:C4-type Zn-finger protein